jgi:hypothetical protein
MTTLALTTLAVALTVGAPARNARPAPQEGQQQDSTAATAQSDAEVAERVDAYLSAIDRPIAPERWRALGPRGAAALAAIASDRGQFPSKRARAVSALSAIGGAQAKRVALELAKSGREAFSVRAAALETASRLASAQELAREITPVLQGAREAPLRAVAADVLSNRAPAASCAAVRAQAAREPQHARQAFANALERCAGAQ